jgi:hypothetical protein
MSWRLQSLELNICEILRSYEQKLVDKNLEARARTDRETDNQKLMQLEEKDVVSSVATVLSDLCGPGEWMPMAKLHSEVCHLLHLTDTKTQIDQKMLV